MDRRRALMRKMVAKKNNFLNVLYQFYIDSAVDQEDLYFLYTTVPLAELTGTGSKYVIGVEDHISGQDMPYVLIYIIPRANRLDADISGVRMPIRRGASGTPSPGAVTVHMDYPMGYHEVISGLTKIVETNSRRTCYILTGASSDPAEMLVRSDMFSGGGGGEGECPSGGSHSTMSIGASGGGNCPNCGTNNLVVDHLQCTKCGAVFESVYCGYCGYSG